MAFKIKRKPTKPIQEQIKQSKRAEIGEWPGHGLPEDALIGKVFGGWGDEQWTWYIPETDEAFARREEAYTQKLLAYEIWEKEFQEEIAQELSRRFQAEADKLEEHYNHLAHKTAKAKKAWQAKLASSAATPDENAR